MRAQSFHKYPFEWIAVSKNRNGPWHNAKFVAFQGHGKVRVDYALFNATPVHKDYRYWTFPIMGFFADDCNL